MVGAPAREGTTVPSLAPTAPGAPPPGQLHRRLGLVAVSASGIGITLGAGIYVLIGTATVEAGSLVWLSFMLAALLGGLTGLAYAELASLFPSAGAEYEFAQVAFNECWGFLAGWLMIAGNVVAAGAVSLGFAQYARHFVDVDIRLAAVGSLAVLYVAVGVAAISVIDWQDPAASDRPLADDRGRLGRPRLRRGRVDRARLHHQHLAAGADRCLEAAVRHGPQGRLASRAWHRQYTPHAPVVAALAAFAVAAAFAWSGRLGLVAAATNFSVYAVFIAVDLAVLRLRRSLPDVPRPVRAGPSIGRWPVAPVLGLCATAAMLVFLEPGAWLVGGGLGSRR
ncbi:MAG: amino acid permease [Dehalococcoidia bacterium]|nr:amino acid permease [Dehalococcoidia bacterium]